MVLPQRARGAALVLALLTLLPGALASHDPSKPLEVHKPDLFPSSPHFMGTDERQPTSVCLDVYNFAPANQGIAGFFDARLRVDRFVNSTPVFYREEYQRTSEALSGGRHLTICWSLALPAGIYRVWAEIDVGNEVDEADETNNAHPRAYLTEVRARPRPNLMIPTGGLLVSPQEGRDGYPQFFRVRILNNGEEPSGETTVLLRDETGVIAEQPLRALVRNEFAEVFVQTDPTLRPPGSYRVVAILDPANVVDEADELDNVASRAYSILPHPMPDVVVRELRVNGTLVERRALRLEATVANEGNRSLGTTTFRFEIDGVPVANQTLDRLVAGANRTLVFPFYLTAGNHTLRVVGDATLAVPELNETNNDLAIAVTVEAIPVERRYPNLVIDRLSALPDDPGPDEVVTVNAYLRNTGEFPSDNVTLAILVDGQRIGNVHVPPIQPDRYHSALFEWTGATLGLHTLRAFVDADAEVPEIHEDDNNDTLFLTIRPPRVHASPPVDRTPPTPDAAPPPGTPANATPPTPPRDATPPVRNATANLTVELTQLSVVTRPVPGGLKGRISVGLRNPTLEAMGRITVAFKVDGQPLKEVLVEGIPPAGLTGTSSGEVDLPPGEHTVEVEARLVGGTGTPAATSQAYAAQAGEKGVPGAPLALVLLGIALLAARRKKSDD